MKAMLLSIILMASVSVFAGEPRAALYRTIAAQTVQGMFGRPGDSVSLSLKDMDHSSDTLCEIWEVSLTNTAATGSALYEITVSEKKDGANEGEEVANIKIKYLSGN